MIGDIGVLCEPELDYAAQTDTGRRRAVNEDSVLARSPCFLVADGMGGHAAGDLASQAAIEAFERGIGPDAPASVDSVGAALDAARAAVDRISAEYARGAGCTLAGVVLVEHDGAPHWLVLNVGDSRVYLHRGSELRQLTVDHSLREEARSDGTADEKLPPRNIITRALGSLDSTADSWLLPVETGSRLLICSDGLTNELGDDELRATLTMGGRAAAVVDELVRRANDAGGRDNITAVVVDTVSGGAAWHTGAESSDVETDEDTLTATLPRRRTP